MIPSGPLTLPSGLADRVDPASYARLLGYPSGELGGERVTSLATSSREWYARHAHPWAYARAVPIEGSAGGRVTLTGGHHLESRRLVALLNEAGADRLIVAAVSAGTEVDAASRRHWSAERPDEGYFLDRFGAAVAVHLAAWTGATLRSAAAAESLGLTPGYSPGYDGWRLADQSVLATCLTEPPAGRSTAGAPAEPLPGRLRVLSSGMIEPKSSLLAVFGVARDRPAADALWERHRCSWCSMSGCGLRGK